MLSLVGWFFGGFCGGCGGVFDLVGRGFDLRLWRKFLLGCFLSEV